REMSAPHRASGEHPPSLHSSPPMQEDPHHLLLYDGECGFCHGAVRFVLAHDRRAAFRFAALQSAVAAAQLARFGGVPTDLGTFYVIERYRSARPLLHSR